MIPSYSHIRGFDRNSFEEWALPCVFLGFPAGAILGGYLIKAEMLPVQRLMLANATFLECLCVLYAMRVIRKHPNDTNLLFFNTR